MTPAARIKASIEIFEIIDNGFTPMDNVIGDYMRGRKYIGSKDRRYIAGFCYKVMRNHAKLNWWFESLEMNNTVRALIILALKLLENKTFDEINEIFDGSKYAAEMLSEEERSLIHEVEGKSISDTKMPEHVVLEVPKQYEEELKAAYKDSYADVMNAFIGEAPLDLRVNLLKADRDQALAALKSDGIKAKLHEYSPWGIRLKEKTFLTTTKAFKKKLVDIQDEGSQLIAHVCNVEPSMQVLDYCAGAGGKTLALANRMKAKGRIVAMDIDSRRLAKAKPRFKRAAVSDIIETRGLDDQKNRKWLRRQKKKFDVTLVDVPCSGTGIWRRGPDLRWKNYGPDLNELLSIQQEILDKIAHTVKPGGRLVYATCSILQQENELQIDAFLKRNEEYELLPLNENWPENSACPNIQEYMRLDPFNHGTDGFFAAVLQRKVGE